MARLDDEDGTIRHKFGERLRELRELRNLSQAAMALRFRMDRSFISDLERGRKEPRLEMLEKIARGFRMSISELLIGL